MEFADRERLLFFQKGKDTLLKVPGFLIGCVAESRINVEFTAGDGCVQLLRGLCANNSILLGADDEPEVAARYGAAEESV